MSDITKKIVRNLLVYDLMSGVFTWKKDHGRKIKKGAAAGSKTSKDGYVSIMIYRKQHLAHRLAFVYMFGFAPDQVDHINHDRTDNRWINLRRANRVINCRNRSLNNNNTSGHVGVTWNKAANKWQAQIGKKYLGVFSEKRAAEETRMKEQAKHGYHKNHGARET